MADAEDSKSSVGNHVRVQVPLSASKLSRDYAGYSDRAHRLVSGDRAHLACTCPVLGNRLRQPLDLRRRHCVLSILVRAALVRKPPSQAASSQRRNLTGCFE